MPEGVKGKHTQICEELDQWRNWGAGSCAHCLAHHGSPSSPADQNRWCGHFNTCSSADKATPTLLSRSHLCDEQADAKPRVKPFHSGRPENHRTLTSAKFWAALQVTINDRNGQRHTSPAAAGETKAGTEAVDGREGGVRYREKLRKYVVEYRPSRFKWKLWMGTYSSQQDGRRAFDRAMFYAGHGKGNYYFADSPQLFQKLGPLQRLFSQVSKDSRDKPFNLELKKRAKEIIKQTARMGDMEMICHCIAAAYQHVDSAIPEVIAGAGGAAASVNSVASPERSTAAAGRKRGDEAGPVAELTCEIFKDPPESKESSDAAFKDLEPLFQLRPPWYGDEQVCVSSSTSTAPEGPSHAAAELRSGSPFFIPGLHSQLYTSPKFVLDSECDESRNDLPLWIYEIILSNSTSLGTTTTTAKSNSKCIQGLNE